MLNDLTADEVAILAHALRMVPGNACLTGKAAGLLAPGKPFAFFSDCAAWSSLWEKVAEAVNTRDDLAPHRKPSEVPA